MRCAQCRPILNLGINQTKSQIKITFEIIFRPCVSHLISRKCSFSRQNFQHYLFLNFYSIMCPSRNARPPFYHNRNWFGKAIWLGKYYFIEKTLLIMTIEQVSKLIVRSKFRVRENPSIRVPRSERNCQIETRILRARLGLDKGLDKWDKFNISRFETSWVGLIYWLIPNAQFCTGNPSHRKLLFVNRNSENVFAIYKIGIGLFVLDRTDLNYEL